MIDEKDSKILEMLIGNGRISHRKISQESGIPVMTVLNRIKRMEKEGIIRNYTVKLNHEKLGFNCIAYMLINVDLSYTQKNKSTSSEIGKNLSKFPFVSCVSNLSGKKDILLRLRARDIRELNKFVDKIGQMEGILSTETLVVLNDISRSVDVHKELMTFLRDEDYARRLLS